LPQPCPICWGNLLASVTDVEKKYAKIIPEYIRSRMAKQGVNVPDRPAMQKALDKKQLRVSRCTSDDDAIIMGRLLHARSVVTGSVSLMGDTYVISASLLDVENGIVVRTVDEYTNSPSRLRAVCNSIARQLAE
jgi:TolB-like protein